MSKNIFGICALALAAAVSSCAQGNQLPRTLFPTATPPALSPPCGVQKREIAHRAAGL